MKMQPWNTGKKYEIGAKKAFTLAQVDELRRHLKKHGPARDLALLDVGVATLVRSSDLLKLKVEDVTDHRGAVVSDIDLTMKKTGEKLTVRLDRNAIKSIEALIDAEGKIASDYLFTRAGDPRAMPLSHQAYLDICKGWAEILGVDPRRIGTHSIRRTMATHLYNRTGNLRAVQRLLGHRDLQQTQRYLDVDLSAALDLLDQHRS